jgi:very-short-patch-repair endonuclease
MPSKYTTESFIHKAIAKHGNQYDYSLVDYSHSKTPIDIVCLIHGVFSQTPETHLRGCGCTECNHRGALNLPKKPMLSGESFIDKANQKHNFVYDYSQSIYAGHRKKLSIICHKHGEFLQSASQHLQGSGCPYCNSSKGESSIRQHLLDQNIRFEEQKYFDGCRNPDSNYMLPFDFYLPDHNSCIEFDGAQHFKPFSFSSDKSPETMVRNFEKQYRIDCLKNHFCISNAILLYRVTKLTTPSLLTCLT